MCGARAFMGRRWPGGQEFGVLLCRPWRGNNGFIWARKWLDIYPKTLEL